MLYSFRSKFQTYIYRNIHTTDETKITRLKDISDHVWKYTKPTCWHGHRCSSRPQKSPFLVSCIFPIKEQQHQETKIVPVEPDYCNRIWINDVLAIIDAGRFFSENIIFLARWSSPPMTFYSARDSDGAQILAPANLIQPQLSEFVDTCTLNIGHLSPSPVRTFAPSMCYPALIHCVLLPSYIVFSCPLHCVSFSCTLGSLALIHCVLLILYIVFSIAK